MEFLSSSKIMHGDLAARNIMLDDNVLQPGRLVAKVADFGLSKNFYSNLTYEKENRVFVPWKWMALEYLMNDYFTLTSDVWSFGVVLWEILSCGRTPYAHQEYDVVISLLEDGQRLQCPTDVKNISTWQADELYDDVSEKCFRENPNERATFSEIIEIIEEKLTSDELLFYLKMNEKYQEERSSKYLKLSHK